MVRLWYTQGIHNETAIETDKIINYDFISFGDSSTVPQYLDVNMNDEKTSHFYWCIPGMQGGYTIPKWKYFLKSHGCFLR
jgi:hypothetical protein